MPHGSTIYREACSTVPSYVTCLLTRTRTCPQGSARLRVAVTLSRGPRAAIAICIVSRRIHFTTFHFQTRRFCTISVSSTRIACPSRATPSSMSPHARAAPPVQEPPQRGDRPQTGARARPGRRRQRRRHAVLPNTGRAALGVRSDFTPFAGASLAGDWSATGGVSPGRS